VLQCSTPEGEEHGCDYAFDDHWTTGQWWMVRRRPADSLGSASGSVKVDVQRNISCEEEWQGVIPWIDGLLVRVSGGSGCTGWIKVGYGLPAGPKELLFSSLDFDGLRDFRMDLGSIATSEAAEWNIDVYSECDLEVYEIAFMGTCPVLHARLSPWLRAMLNAVLIGCI
jgi:hypothetical protein